MVGSNMNVLFRIPSRKRWHIPTKREVWKIIIFDFVPCLVGNLLVPWRVVAGGYFFSFLFPMVTLTNLKRFLAKKYRNPENSTAIYRYISEKRYLTPLCKASFFWYPCEKITGCRLNRSKMIWIQASELLQFTMIRLQIPVTKTLSTIIDIGGGEPMSSWGVPRLYF